MRLLSLFFCLLLLLGCAKQKPAFDGETFPVPPKKEAKTPKSKPEPKPSPAKTKAVEQKPAPIKEGSATLTPSLESFGRVAMVNPSARYVILTFPIGEVAPPERLLNVYRDGLKVAELRVTGPQRENNTAADIVRGEPRVDDEVRGD